MPKPFELYDYKRFSDIERNPYPMQDPRNSIWAKEDDFRVLLNCLDRYADYLEGTEQRRNDMACPVCQSVMKRSLSIYGAYWRCSRWGCQGTRDSMGRSKEEREKEKEKDDR